MQIGADVGRGLSSGEPLEDQIAIVFRETLGLIHSTLLFRYRMEEAEAEALERDLRSWFQRLCERPGAPPARDSRHSLLVMACLFARGHQRERIASGARKPDERLDRVLRRDPVDVAREVSRGMKLLFHRLHGG